MEEDVVMGGEVVSSSCFRIQFFPNTAWKSDKIRQYIRNIQQIKKVLSQ